MNCFAFFETDLDLDLKRILRFMIPILNLLKDFILLIVQPIKAERSPQTRRQLPQTPSVGNFKILTLSSLSCIFCWSSHADMTNPQWQFWRCKQVFLHRCMQSYCNLVLHAVLIITMTWQKSRGWVCLAPHSLAVGWWGKDSCYLEMTLSFSAEKKTYKIISNIVFILSWICS